MIPTLLFVAFIVMLLMGVPIGAALGLAGAACIALANADAQWFGLLAVPQNFYAGLGKYPLLAIPMFVLVGSIFDRSGVALRLVNLAVAIVGRGPGMLPLVAIAVAMFLGGISGSGPANAAAVGGVMILAMSRAGYPPAFSASVVGAAAATDILIPPSIAFIVYSVLVPGASVPALFAAGMIPGVMAGLALMIPAVWLARKHKMGALEASLPRPEFWKSLREAVWGLAAPVLILGGMRAGWFTPTEAAVVAAVYSLFVSVFIYKELNFKKLVPLFVSAAVTCSVVMFLVASAMVSAWLITVANLPAQVVALLQPLLDSPKLLMLAIMVLTMVVGTALDMTPTILLLTPVLMPVVKAAGIDPVYFGVMFIINNAIGLITPPVGTVLNAVAGVGKIGMDEVTKGVIPFMIAQFAIMFLMVAFPQLVMVPARWFY